MTGPERSRPWVDVNVAMLHVHRWLIGFERQLSRLQADDAMPGNDLGKEADFAMAVYAAAQFRRAVAFVADEAVRPGEARYAIRAALRAFDASVQAKDVRDLDAHFDEYAAGRGVLQLAGQLPPSALGDYYFDTGTSYGRVIFRNPGDPDLSIDLGALDQAVSAVCDVLRDVLP